MQAGSGEAPEAAIKGSRELAKTMGRHSIKIGRRVALWPSALVLAAAGLAASGCSSNQAALITAMTEAQRIQADALTSIRNQQAAAPAAPSVADLLAPALRPNQKPRRSVDPARAKQPSREELMRAIIESASEAYRELTGKPFFPENPKAGGPSQDPEINKNWWAAKEGATLYRTLSQWAERAEWKIVWKSSYEYPIEAGAVFVGGFTDAVDNVLKAFEDTYPPLHVTYYKNRVAVIENHDGNY